MTPRLITIPFSHYCEKARWALEYAGIDYREEGHAPLLHWAATLANRGGRTVPLLVTDEGTFADSTDILRWADRRAAPGRALYPPGDGEAAELEERFDTVLGPATRRLAYFYLLPDRRATLAVATARVPRLEAALLRGALPLVRGMLRRGLRIDAAGMARSEARVREVFAAVGARLSDGRRWLCPSGFSAADLTFAALAAPVLIPAQYGAPLPSVEEVPPAFARLVRELRAGVAGAFALRVFAEARNRAAAPA